MTTELTSYKMKKTTHKEMLATKRYFSNLLNKDFTIDEFLQFTFKSMRKSEVCKECPKC